MKLKRFKWASPLFIVSLAIAGLFGVSSAVIANQKVNDAPVMEKAEAAVSSPSTLWFRDVYTSWMHSGASLGMWISGGTDTGTGKFYNAKYDSATSLYYFPVYDQSSTNVDFIRVQSGKSYSDGSTTYPAYWGRRTGLTLSTSKNWYYITGHDSGGGWYSDYCGYYLVGDGDFGNWNKQDANLLLSDASNIGKCEGFTLSNAASFKITWVEGSSVKWDSGVVHGKDKLDNTYPPSFLSGSDNIDLTTGGTYDFYLTTGHKISIVKHATITYNVNGAGGSVTPATKDVIETYTGATNKYGDLAVPTRTGYDFVDWYDASTGGNVVDENTSTVGMATSITIYAHWEPATYTITYKDQGNVAFSGTTSSPTSYTYGTGATLLTATKPGYTFGGWFDNSSCTGTAVTSISGTATGNKTLYAKWTLDTITYSFTGSSDDYHSMSYNDENNYAISNFIKNFYVQNVTQTSGQQLYLKVNGVAVPNSNISCITATDHYDNGRLNNLQMVEGVPKIRYSGITGAIDVDAYNDNGTVKYKVYAHGVLETSGENYSLIKNGDTFIYAPQDAETDPWGHTRWVTKDVFLSESDHIKFIHRTAEFSDANPYNPVYVDSEADSLLTIDSSGAKVKSGKEGYYDIYIQYTTDGTQVQVIYGDRGGKLTFDMNGHGSAIDPLYAKYNSGEGEVLSAPTAPTATGYTFGGWYKESGCTNAWDFSEDAVTVDTILYAKWTANQYTVTYANGGHGTAPSSTTATYGTTFTTASAITGVTGYTFDHWHGSNGTDYNASTGFTYNIAGGLTLTAVWTNNVYTITLDNQSATTSGTGTIYEKYADGYYTDVSCTSSLSTITKPTKNNCTFGGYYTAVGGDGTQIINANGSLTAAATNIRFTSNTTLYAKWTFTIAYNSNGGSGTTSSTTLTYGVAGSLSANGFSAPNDGHIFGTWNTNSSGSGTNYSSGASLDVSQVNALANSSTRTLYAKWTSGEEAAIEFAANFNSAIGLICTSYNTNTKDSFLTNWNGTQEIEYNKLEDYEKYWLLAAGRSSDDDIVEMIGNGSSIKGKYDYVLGKYGYGDGDSNLHDFLGRTPASNSAYRGFALGNIFGSDDNNVTTIIIVVASSVALLSVTALSILVIKKRKQGGM